MQEAFIIVFYVFILIYSAIIHEVAHGLMALWLGDATAKYAGRITLNPLSHIDPMMTIMMPILMLIASGGAFAFGGAKPVPYNPYNLKNQKWGPTLVAFAGPASNIIMALFFAVVAKLLMLPMAMKKNIIMSLFRADWNGLAIAMAGSIEAILFTICIMVIFWNVLLAFFNLIPIPPLDGSKLLFAVLPIKIETMAILEQFGFIALLFVVIVFSVPLGIFLNFMLSLFMQIAI